MKELYTIGDREYPEILKVTISGCAASGKTLLAGLLQRLLQLEGHRVEIFEENRNRGDLLREPRRDSHGWHIEIRSAPDWDQPPRRDLDDAEDERDASL